MIREGKWNRKVGTARWDGGGKRSWKRGGCKGVEAGGDVQLKWEKELELRRDTMGVGEKMVKYGWVELWKRKGCKLRRRWVLMGEDK